MAKPEAEGAGEGEVVASQKPLGLSGSGFEARVSSDNKVYEMLHVARIGRMSPEVRWVKTGRGFTATVVNRAPFDFIGYTLGALVDRGIPSGRIIGIECKSSLQPKSRLPLCEDTKDSGLAAYQLMSLEAIARAGGVARVVWNNGGHIGVMVNDDILQAAHMYRTNAKSLPWTMFRAPAPLTSGRASIDDWLMLEAEVSRGRLDNRPPEEIEGNDEQNQE